uniref:Uncharacterized protein n=1 Tax=Haptolina brevifila TaxID=156173 RepID=A0A7S2ISW4_9EUKA|mmetsp:Transcript_70569/g.139856  ORF Transcript_70569/g.139856 Transcript_70569/m.139856 type:complete len:157 (+) Transcript_70569:101-571(+)
MARVEPPSMMGDSVMSNYWSNKDEAEEDELPMGRATLKLRSQAIVEEAEHRPPTRPSPAPGDGMMSHGSWHPTPSLPPSQPLPPSQAPSISSYTGRGHSLPSQQAPAYGSKYPQQPGAPPRWSGQPSDDRKQWSLTPEMMNQPWGTVLRTLNRTER